LVIALQGMQGETVGGIWGKTVYDWLYIELLAVPEAWHGRGLGRKLLQQAERIARERGCVGAWLDTFAFQARGFYEKQGYSLFGDIADHPKGSSRYFLKKIFVEAAASAPPFAGTAAAGR
jgi:GNAT superfamily N-acetyltransferase